MISARTEAQVASARFWDIEHKLQGHTEIALRLREGRIRVRSRRGGKPRMGCGPALSRTDSACVRSPIWAIHRGKRAGRDRRVRISKAVKPSRSEAVARREGAGLLKVARAMAPSRTILPTALPAQPLRPSNCWPSVPIWTRRSRRLWLDPLPRKAAAAMSDGRPGLSQPANGGLCVRTGIGSKRLEALLGTISPLPRTCKADLRRATKPIQCCLQDGGSTHQCHKFDGIKPGQAQDGRSHG